jgi:hypothetical protein
MLDCIYNFHFGVLHPAARALSRLSEKPSFETTVQGVYCIHNIHIKLAEISCGRSTSRKCNNENSDNIWGENILSNT